MKIFILFYSWQCGGIETRSYRFYKNLINCGYDARLISVNATEKQPQNVLCFPELEVFSRKNFLDYVKKEKILKEDILFLFRPGSNVDGQHFEKYGLEKLPFYFEHLKYFENCKKIVYMYGNAETQQMAYYPQVIEKMDFVASSFLVNKNRERFFINDPFRKENLAFEKPIWWFNISISPKERKIVKTFLEKPSLLKNNKSVIFTGRVTPEKSVVRLIRTFLRLDKKKFDCRIYGVDSFSRERWYAEQKFGKENFDKFYFGKYNGIFDAKKVLKEFNFGINLRKKNHEKFHILEQTTIEYMINGVLPIISDNFLPKEKKLPLRIFVYESGKENKEEDFLFDIITENFDKKRNKNYRIDNWNYLLKYHNGKKVVESFLEFIEKGV